MGIPSENREGYEATSLVARAKELHGRLLLVHGTYDDNVQPQNEQSFMNALIAHGIVFDAMVYPMRKHGISDAAAQAHLFNRYGSQKFLRAASMLDPGSMLVTLEVQ